MSQILDGYPVKKCPDCGTIMRADVSVLYCPKCEPLDKNYDYRNEGDSVPSFEDRQPF